MNEEKNVAFNEAFYVISKRKKIIIIITLAATIISALLSYFVMSPVYQAEVSVIVGKSSDAANQNLNYNDVMMYQNLVKTYAESRIVAMSFCEPRSWTRVLSS